MTDPPANQSSDEAEYSRAFEKLVEGRDDVVGLLAYATYKQSVRESAQEGRKTDKLSRSLPPAMISALRSSAEQMLTQIVNNGIAQATPDIQDTAINAALNAHHAEVIASLQSERQRVEQFVEKRTAFLPAFGTNLLAWIVGLFATVAILFLAASPSVETTLTKKLGATTQVK